MAQHASSPSSSPVSRNTLRGMALTSAAIALMAFLAACGKGPGGPGGHGGPGGPPAVAVAPAVQRTVQEFDEYNARLEATETVDIRARVAGTLDRVHFREGQQVTKGQVLFTIDARPFAADVARAQAQVQSAQTQAQLAASEVTRAEKLLPMQAISQQEFDTLRANARNGAAQVAAAQAALQSAQLNLGYATVRAPITGRVSRANVTAGNLVGVAEPVLTTVVSMNKVYAYFDASEATYLKYVRGARDGSRPSSRDTPNAVQMGLANETGYPHQGVMDFVDNRLNPNTGSIRGRAVFDNAQGQFTPGLFARIKLIGSGSYTTTLVPDKAINTDQTRKVVFVVGAGNVVEPREVKIGALFDGMRAVTGVKAGENIIVDGLQRAFPGAPVTPELLKVDDKGMPIFPPPAAPGAPGDAGKGDAKAGGKDEGKKDSKDAAK